jgi:Uma2 family endonuclease
MDDRVRFTITDIESLPDRLDDTRYELIDGELLVAPQPPWEHQWTVAAVCAALHGWSRRTRFGAANRAPGIIFSPHDCVAPDAVWISRERLARTLRDGKLYAAPDLAVEVLSPGTTNERRDRDLKPKLYAREGVEEYWLIDWRAHTVEIYRRAGDALELAASLTDGDTLTSPLLPDFAYPVGDLWEPALQ